MFEPLEEESFSLREKRILQFWLQNRIFEKSVAQREGRPLFSFYDGPPFATGLPHYGHLLAGTIKDTVLRYKTMRGFYAPRRFGWDCHGLPIEQQIEKDFNLSGAPDIEKFGIDRFNEACRGIVLRYTQEWRHTVERMGRWVDFSKTWTTMDPTFMESVWWVFKQLYQKDLIYQGTKVVPYSAKLGTPLSNFEAGENYRDVDDPSLVVAFPLKNDPRTHLLAWTTTPWTLISNMALAIGPDITYVKIEELEKGGFYILAKDTLARWFPDAISYRLVGTFQGNELVGKVVEPPFDYFSEKRGEGAFRIIAADFVDLGEGTGIVHMAPAFGEIDYYVCQQAGIPLVCPVDQNGRFTSEIVPWAGQFVKEADKSIIRELKARGKIVYSGQIRHRYPFCWRSDTPLIYKAISTWFLSVEKIKDSLVASNQLIHWVPGHLKEGRFGKWLEGARDWAISRNRYWGTPIPIWKSEEREIHVIGSKQELETLTQTKISDLHRHFIDPLTFEKDGKVYRRITEVFDCWFDAGAMPYGQNHYPFANKELTEKTFPADFIAEGIDQTRGWFYTLLVLSVALWDRPAYKNVVVNGIILAEDGSKMSKRLKNYPEPDLILDKYGADAVRLYMLASPAVKADDLSLSEKGIELTLRQVLIPLWNAYVFFHTYASIYNYKPQKNGGGTHILDRWILASMAHLIEKVAAAMDSFELSQAVDPFVEFIDGLTNWYIRRSRRRFWEESDPKDHREAFDTLYLVLLTLSKLIAPFVPFLSEAIYRNLRDEEMAESVHLSDFPAKQENFRNKSLEEGMERLKTVVSLGHALRKESKIKVRQPLKALHIVTTDSEAIEFLDQQRALILDELNIKEMIIHRARQDFMQLGVRPNFRALGKRAGSHLKEVQLAIASLNQNEIESLQNGQTLLLKIHGQPFAITSDDVEITPIAKSGWCAMHLGNFTLALDTEMDETLILEGIARELVNKINNLRKELNFSVTDRIILYMGATPKIQKAMECFGHYVFDEVLAIKVIYEQKEGAHLLDINGEPVAIALERAAQSI